MRSLTRLFDAVPHVRKHTRNGKPEDQYRLDVNPKLLRPIASKLSVNGARRSPTLEEAT